MLNQIDLSRIDLNLLVVFHAVVEEGHVGRVATRLNLTPSAVSHRLTRLRRLLNDPLFLRTPKGVAPTDRAIALAEPIAEILARIRGVVESAEPFDPGTSTRRFTIGAPDAVAEVLVRGLLAEVERRAPGVNIGLRQTLAQARGRPGIGSWQAVLPDLERREIDIAVIPLDTAPARFRAHTLYEEDFVAICRAGHTFATDSTLDTFCAARHLIVSQAGDPRGFVDVELERLSRARRVALTTPNFMMGLTLVAETDLIAAFPRHVAALYARRYGLAVVELPVPVVPQPIQAVAPEAAMMDAGVAWLFETLCLTADLTTFHQASSSEIKREFQPPRISQYQ